MSVTSSDAVFMRTPARQVGLFRLWPMTASILPCLIPKQSSLAALRCAGLLSHSQGLFYYIGGDRKPVGLSDRLLELMCIIPISGVL